MPAKINPDQMVLPGVEMAWCKCGCGQSFMRVAKGRRREYLNKTHKKREARRLAKMRQTSTTVRLAPKGYLYLNASGNHEISALWDAMDPVQQAIIEALCRTGYTSADLQAAIADLFEAGAVR